MLLVRLHRYSLMPALLIIAALLLQPVTLALASTVGTIAGTVVDDATGAAIAGATVVAVSPSGRYVSRTDAHGYYAIAGVQPDTYTVSAQHAGYEPQPVTGLSVFADQTARADVRMSKSLKTIAAVTARSAGGAFQPNQTADTYSVGPAQIQQIQGNPLNTSEKNLVASLPGASYTNGDAPSIRGGRSNNVDYEFDGIPLINPYTNGNVNNYSMPSFGLQSLQLSPGNEDASFGNSGVGTINAVPRRGSYPGEFDAILGVGAPHFYHAAALGYGIASPNGRFSDYMSYTAANTAPRYGGNLEPDSTLNGSYGDIQLTTDREFTNNFIYNFGRDNRFDVQYFIDNGFHKRAAGYGMGLDYNVDVTSSGGTLITPMCYATCNPAWTSYFGNDTASALSVYPYWCAQGSKGGSGNPYPITDTTLRCGDWTGLTTQQFQQMVSFYPGQTSAYETLAGRPYYQEFNNNDAQKVSLDWRPDSRTIATVSYYNTATQYIQDSVSIYPFESGDVWNLQGGWQNAINLDITRNLSDKHLLKFGGSDYRDRPLFQTISPLTALFNPLFNGNFEYLDFIPPGQICPGQNGNPIPAISWGFNPTYSKDPSVLENSFTNSCGWIYTQPGFTNTKFMQPPMTINGNRLNPSGGSVYVDDTFTPNDRFKAQVGVRVDYRNNNLPPAVVNADCTTTYLPLLWGVYPANVYDAKGNLIHSQNFDPNTGLFNGKPMGPGNCPAATFLPVTNDEAHPITPQPRIALSERIGSNDAVRFSYGRTMRYPNMVFGDAGVQASTFAQFAGLPSHTNNNQIIPFEFTPFQLSATSQNNYYTQNNIATTCGMVSYGIAVPCTSYAEQLYWNGWNGNFGKPMMPLAPITYSNFDLSYEHQFAGGWSTKLTPWSRRAYNLDVSSEVINPYVTPHLNADGTPSYSYFGLLSNAGLEIARGVELYVTKTTPWHGLTGSFSASWQNDYQNIDPAGTPAGAARDVTGTSNNENGGFISQSAAAFPGFYHVNYVTPFWSSLTLQYEKNGWRFQTQWLYDAGYPYGEGTHVYQTFAGVAHEVPSSNDCGNSAASYADPTNPGSCFSPNIVATRGTNEGNFANQVFTHPNLVASLTLERDLGAGKLGFTIDNLFNEIYTGPTLPNGIDYGRTGPLLSDSYGFDAKNGMYLNPNYQPVATGVSGPLSGLNLPGGPANVGLLCGTCAYIHYPNGEGRTYYVYYQFKLGGAR
jgi:hypothetical protein